MAENDSVQDLIKTAADKEPAQSTTPPAGGEESPAASSAPSDASGLMTEVTALAQQLAELMLSNPQVAERIADVLEDLGKEGADMVEEQSTSAGALPSDSTPDLASSAPAVDPVIQARLAEIERQLADHELDRELGRIKARYGQLRPHFGDVLPEEPDEKALLQKTHEILSGKVSPLDVALAAYLLEQATAGEGTLRDRILALAAQSAQRPPAVEGRSGGVAVRESAPDVAKMSTTQLLDYIKSAVATKRGQPG